MSDDQQHGEAQPGEVVTATIRYQVHEVCRICGIGADLVVAMVAHGVVVPMGTATGSWSFTGTELLRLKRAWRLHRDLGVELNGLGLVLELLDEVERLRQRLGQAGS